MEHSQRSYNTISEVSLCGPNVGRILFSPFLDPGCIKQIFHIFQIIQNSQVDINGGINDQNLFLRYTECYQKVHFFLGFMDAEIGQLKAIENS